ncbi:MAG: hypothetical protein PW788_13655 [Micavibrio sp.]|nr:hypothetical protein [Micavibrio sp.]
MSQPASKAFNDNANDNSPKFRNAFLKATAGLVLAAGALGLAGCDTRQSEVVSQNLSQAADNFEIDRRIVFYNSITNTYMLEIQGKCSIKPGQNTPGEIAVICKTGPDAYKKHYLAQSNNVTYFMEQLDSANVSAYNYSVTFNPQIIVPDVVVQGSGKDLKNAVTPRAGVLQSAAPAPAPK